MVTLKEYQDLVADRPAKFTREQVGYRKAEEGEPECEECLHFFERRLDKFAVCEIFRDNEIDRDGINPKWTCTFHTVDGEKFPLLEKK